MRILSVAIAAVACLAISSAASAEGRFSCWCVGLGGMNPGNSLVFSGDSWQGHATGSFVGVSVGKGLQYGNFYTGLDLELNGGVVETQERGYVALNGLGGLTFKAGWVFWDRVLVYGGLGPDITWATFGPSATSLKSQIGSGAHILFGVEVALDQKWSTDFNLRRQRTNDLTDINSKDAWWGMVRIKYALGG